MYIFGGESSSGFLNDFWKLNLGLLSIVSFLLSSLLAYYSYYIHFKIHRDLCLVTGKASGHGTANTTQSTYSSRPWGCDVYHGRDRLCH